MISECIYDTSSKMAALDKFKRRLIHSVARLIHPERVPDHVMWDTLRRETNTECKPLWQRMRSLTLKKLNRLLLADDLSENIVTVARMSMTDWLFFDLVLVHENVDFTTTTDGSPGPGDECRPLLELFSLVQQYKLEDARGEDLVNGWACATLQYNSVGRQCSPMLLQRRWYQMKEHTRNQFYSFWSKYRGNSRNLEADSTIERPTRIQMAIAKRYPHIITEPFEEWKSLLAQGLVITPEEFDNRDKKKVYPTVIEDDPEFILIEPEVDTINVDSGDENSNKSEELYPIIVKEEPTDSNTLNEDFDNEDIIDDKEIVERIINRTMQDRVDEALRDVDINIEKVSNDNYQDIDTVMDINEKADEVLPQITSVCGNIDSFSVTTEIINSDEEEDIIKQKADEFLRNTPKVKQVAPVNSEETPEAVDIIKLKADEYLRTGVQSQEKLADVQEITETINDSDEEDIVKLKVDQYLKENVIISPENKPPAQIEDVIQVAQNSSSDDEDIIKLKADEYLKQIKETKEGSLPVELPEVDIAEIIKEKAENFVSSQGNLKDAGPDHVFDLVHTDLNLLDDGIEFVDEGIAYDDGCQKPKLIDADHIKNEDKNTTETPKFDVKLLMTPIVYTTKVDKMITMNGKSINEVNNAKLISKIFHESKPVCKLPTELPDYLKPDADLNTDGDYLIHNNDVRLKSEPNDNAGETYLPYEEILECNKVKITSYLLQKPKNRNYNPVVLCKNPDFNTRLRRLNVGFFTSIRNRQLLKCLKPLTIDLSKAFESKLIDGTMYLKSEGVTIKCEVVTPPNDIQAMEQTSTVVPSATAVQSLIDNLDPSDVVLNYGTNPYFERSKVIHLPDKDAIRQINQNLRTAEVTPMQVLISGTYDPATRTSTTTTFVENNQQAGVPDVSKLAKKGRPPTKPTSENPLVKTSNLQNKNRNPKFTPKWFGVKLHKINESALITPDTLQKMLAVVTDGGLIFSKKKELKKRQQIAEANKIVHARIVPKTPKSNVQASTAEKPAEKPKERITIPILKSKPSMGRNKVKKVKHCCWAAEKIYKKVTKPEHRMSQHMCQPPICKCCCRGQLVEVYRLKPKCDTPTDKNIVQTSKLTNICKPIEGVAEQAHKDNTAKKLTPVLTTRILSPIKNLETPHISNIQPDVHSSMKTKIVKNPVLGESPKTVPVPRIYTKSFARFHPNLSHVVKRPMIPEPCTVPPTVDLEETNSTIIPDPSNILTSSLSKCLADKCIVIDGTQKFMIPKTLVNSKMKEKHIYLSSSQIAKNPIDNPIFLGRNKILLTTVDFPKNFTPDACKPVTPVTTLSSCKIVPTTPLPNGVQITLMPNGLLTYVLEPGISLSEKELADVQVVLAAVQQQIYKTSSLNSQTDIPSFDLTDEPCVTKQNESLEREDEVIESSENSSCNKEVDQLKNADCESNTKSSKNALDNEKEYENVNKKTILSDLMEMSGISEQDAATVEVPRTVNVQQPPALVPIKVTSESSESLPINLTSTDVSNVTKLNPVTSFAELKYACQQEGKFFKLDFDTGVISPIMVCIKKNTKANLHNAQISVIDLTEEDSTETDDLTPSLPKPVESPAKCNLTAVKSTVSESKVPSAKYTSLAGNRKSLLKTRHLPLILNRKKIELRKKHSKIEAHIDLLNSDEEPMEEEYLEDSDAESNDNNKGENSTNDFDSSDDEPLIKKSKHANIDALDALDKNRKHASENLLTASSSVQITIQTGEGPDGPQIPRINIELTRPEEPATDVQPVVTLPEESSIEAPIVGDDVDQIDMGLEYDLGTDADIAEEDTILGL